MNRRMILMGGAAALAVLPLKLGAAPAFAQAAATDGPFKLPALPYEPNALEPAIDAETMSLHHDKHHQAYVTNLNKAVAADPQLQGKDLETLIRDAGQRPAAVRNNGGGHWNHSFFWETMSPTGKQSAPSPELLAAINSSFGSMDEFTEKFNAAGAGRFGSGWVWLIKDDQGKLAITTTPNQDNPLMDVAEVKGTPILGNDVWEHAYYLKYNNRRPDYLKAWWQVVNWPKASERYALANKA
ncbi:Fe-Mn family superoxide dismutase [Rhodoligotrophos appendicifer]|uniref:superoxide dismutase n=1 Tax=Rhodoligotrophos appendicifer TaxID=987056 RepID=UPI001FE35C55|nr:superoxide dismutase [Rhodoligotrophos appendicifer]